MSSQSEEHSNPNNDTGCFAWVNNNKLTVLLIVALLVLVAYCFFYKKKSNEQVGGLNILKERKTLY